mmetsp:Transcript_17827/g.45224  ORF Transcript_17827/g.45224 Transcript_17827/m.45224 type:complete len:200 (-) Transcript_17827:576-1175(-)
MAEVGAGSMSGRPTLVPRVASASGFSSCSSIRSMSCPWSTATSPNSDSTLQANASRAAGGRELWNSLETMNCARRTSEISTEVRASIDLSTRNSVALTAISSTVPKINSAPPAMASAATPAAKGMTLHTTRATAPTRRIFFWCSIFALTCRRACVVLCALLSRLVMRAPTPSNAALTCRSASVTLRALHSRFATRASTP